MKLINNKVEMTASLSISKKEVEMLSWLAGYGGSAISEAITKNLTTKYSRVDWEDLWNSFESELARVVTSFENVEDVWRGKKIAVDPTKAKDYIQTQTEVDNSTIGRST